MTYILGCGTQLKGGVRMSYIRNETRHCHGKITLCHSPSLIARKTQLAVTAHCK